MSAYVVVQVEIKDPVRYEDYRKMVLPTIEQYGGRFLVRGGRVHTMEGDWAPKRFVVVEFPSVERAKAWWDGPEYRPARDLRWATAESQLIIAEGL